MGRTNTERQHGSNSSGKKGEDLKGTNLNAREKKADAIRLQKTISEWTANHPEGKLKNMPVAARRLRGAQGKAILPARITWNKTGRERGRYGLRRAGKCSPRTRATPFQVSRAEKRRSEKKLVEEKLA